MEKQIYCWDNSTKAGGSTVGTESNSQQRFDSDLHRWYSHAHGCSKIEEQIHDLAQLFSWEKQLAGAVPSHLCSSESSRRAEDGCAGPAGSGGTKRKCSEEGAEAGREE